MTPPSPAAILTRAQTQALTRERLIVAARDAIANRGFAGASVRDIAEAAGYSQGAFYSNFKGKEALALELMRRHMTDEAAVLNGVLKDSRGAPGLIMKSLEMWGSTLNGDLDWSRLAMELQLHATRNPAFAADYATVRDRHRDTLADLLTQLFSRLSLKLPAPAGDIAMGFMALAQGLALQTMDGSGRAAGRLVIVFLKGLIASARETSG